MDLEIFKGKKKLAIKLNIKSIFPLIIFKCLERKRRYLVTNIKLIGQELNKKRQKKHKKTEDLKIWMCLFCINVSECNKKLMEKGEKCLFIYIYIYIRINI